ncbi:MAG: CDP-alcohol phosphatidyltransferase family protein [Verrucomicrobiota bacterium]
MEDQHKHTRLSLANRITILRILGVPVFILMLVYYTQGLARGEAMEIHRAAALAIFAALALTDALDGYLARSRNEISPLGKLLDPLADKALLLSALVLLTKPSLPALEPHIPIWFTLLVISRDVLLIVGAAIIHAFAGFVEVKPRIVGKIATFFQMVAITWVLVGGAARPFMACVALAGVFTFTSGLIYVLDGVRQLERAAAAHRHPHPPA